MYGQKGAVSYKKIKADLSAESGIKGVERTGKKVDYMI